MIVLQLHDLQHRPEPGGLENVRLVFRREVDGLGVAAAIDIEHPVIAPHMLVVADEIPFRIGREGGLART